MKDRKMAQKISEKKGKDTVYLVLSIAAVMVLIYLVLHLSSDPIARDDINRSQCPHKVEGNLNASFVIKYVDSPTCIWCFFEEPILKRLVENKGDSLRLERYDIRFCDEIVSRYRFTGTPSFVFSIENGTKEFSHTGFIKEEELYVILCSATGDCYLE